MLNNDPLICLIQIGGTNTNVLTRTIGRMQWWQQLIDNEVYKAWKWGFRRILLQNPFGTLPGEFMQFDQYIHARDGKPGFHPPLPTIVNGFVEAWRGDNFDQVIAYLGTMVGDNDFTTTNFMSRAAESISLPLLAGMGIGFDMATYQPKDLAYKVVKNVNEITSTLVEGYPSNTLLSHHRSIESSGYLQAISNGDIKRCTGEVSNWIVPPPGHFYQDAPAWFPSTLKGTIGNGHSVIRELQTYIDCGFMERSDLGL